MNTTRNGVIQSNTMPYPVLKDDDENVMRRFNGKVEAYGEYLNFCKKSIILDRGFDATLPMHPAIAYLIETHGWQEFAMHHSEDSYYELCREFFANMIWNKPGVTWVRGCVVHFDRNTLNTLFRTQGYVEQLTYEQINRLIHRNESGAAIVSPAARKFCGKRPRLIKGIELLYSNDIKTEFQPSVDFFISKIMPMCSLLFGNRLFGLLELWLGKGVDIGKIVEKTLLNQSRSQGVICYPNLIRRLCETAGVDLTQFDEADKIILGAPIPLPQVEPHQRNTYMLMQPAKKKQKTTNKAQLDIRNAADVESRRASPPPRTPQSGQVSKPDLNEKMISEWARSVQDLGSQFARTVREMISEQNAQRKEELKLLMEERRWEREEERRFQEQEKEKDRAFQAKQLQEIMKCQMAMLTNILQAYATQQFPVAGTSTSSQATAPAAFAAREKVTPRDSPPPAGTY